jgi:hypothetical protein
MKSIYDVPTNSKTLFLRNLETILIFSDVLNSNDLDDFRKGAAQSILEILDKFQFSCEDKSHPGLINQYIANSIAIRNYVDNLSKTSNISLY